MPPGVQRHHEQASLVTSTSPRFVPRPFRQLCGQGRALSIDHVDHVTFACAGFRFAFTGRTLTSNGATYARTTVTFGLAKLVIFFNRWIKRQKKGHDAQTTAGRNNASSRWADEHRAHLNWALEDCNKKRGCAQESRTLNGCLSLHFHTEMRGLLMTPDCETMELHAQRSERSVRAGNIMSF